MQVLKATYDDNEVHGKHAEAHNLRTFITEYGKDVFFHSCCSRFTLEECKVYDWARLKSVLTYLAEVVDTFCSNGYQYACNMALLAVSACGRLAEA